MAEAVVTYVLQKIGEAAYQEALIQYGAKDKVVWAKKELEWVSAFLKDADAKAKQNLDNRVKQWVKDVKEVAYMIEDVLDKYMVEVQGGPKKPGVLKKIRSVPNILVARHRVSKEIDDIKERLSTIEKRAVTYKIEKLSDGRTGRGPANNPVDWPKFPDVDEATVVGFKSHVIQIVEQLTDKRNLERSVISIVGTGGLGKTTHAKLVYKSASVKSHFASCMWVTISKEYNPMDILKKILKEIKGRDSNMQQMEIDDLGREIRELLRQKTYIIILDDVWSTDLWTKLKEVLPEEKNGSRVLITTRSKQVAEVADYRTKPYELEFLNEEKSLELMLRNAFPNRFKEKCPEDLADLAMQFSKRCGGLPLALVVMGRILSQKEPDLISWSEFLEKVSWHTDGEDCMKIVSTSYEELPPHLKLCFMYFATFPEDWEIKAGPLIRLWIAEGFITQETNEIMEDTAKKYLEELAQRCMVQVTKRSTCRGAIKYCRVHDILHELAIRKAQEDNFITVQSNSNNNSTSNPGSLARRIVLHLGDTIPVGSIGPNYRSLTSYGGSLPNTDELRMATVVNLQKSYNEHPTDFDLNSLKHLTTMRYLQISIESYGGVDTTILTYHTPWKFLQTLDLSNSYVTNGGDVWNNFYTCITCLYSRKNVPKQELHHSFWNNRMLRHVIWSEDDVVLGPPSSAHLENLLTLKGVHARDEWTVKLPDFPRIRKLKVHICSDFDWAAMTNLMSKLVHLCSLFVWSSGEEPMKDPCITPAFRNFRNMYKLILHCTWPENAAIDSSIFPPHLVRLQLGWSQLRQDPMPELGKLPNLRFLYLQSNSYVGEQIICSAGGFKCLQQLKFDELENLKEIKIENGTMRTLNLFEIGYIPKMEIVPDLQYLANLRELSYNAMSDEFCARLKGEDQYKVQHILSIIKY